MWDINPSVLRGWEPTDISWDRWVVPGISGWFLGSLDGYWDTWMSPGTSGCFPGISGWFLRSLDGYWDTWMSSGTSGWFVCSLNGSWDTWMVSGTPSPHPTLGVRDSTISPSSNLLCGARIAGGIKGRIPGDGRGVTEGCRGKL